MKISAKFFRSNHDTIGEQDAPPKLAKTLPMNHPTDEASKYEVLMKELNAREGLSSCL